MSSSRPSRTLALLDALIADLTDLRRDVANLEDACYRPRSGRRQVRNPEEGFRQSTTNPEDRRSKGHLSDPTGDTALALVGARTTFKRAEKELRPAIVSFMGRLNPVYKSVRSAWRSIDSGHDERADNKINADDQMRVEKVAANPGKA